jgi:Transcriptional regulator
MLDITLKQLEAFVTAAEYNSFTRAAKELYLTQSTVSSHINMLEQVLGVQLILRGARKKPVLTEEGKRVYAAAKDVLGRSQTLQDLTELRSGELSIGASTVPAQHLLPALMSGFLHKYSDSRYLLKRGDSAQIHRLLEQGEVRIGFVGAALDRKNCIYYPLIDDRLVLITDHDVRFSALQKRGISGRELLGEPMIAREESSGTRQTFNAYLRHSKLSPDKLNIIACMDNPEAIKNSVARGMGVAVISQLAVQEELASGKLLAFNLDPVGLFRKIFIVWRKETSLTQAEQCFVCYVRAAVREWGIDGTDGKAKSVDI